MAKINDQYDIGAAFEAIENELIDSMIRNMRRHKVEEINEKKQWTMWQAEQLKALEKYRKENQKKFEKKFSTLNGQIDALIRAARDEGEMQQEIQILNAIKKGFSAKKAAAGATAEFFRLNNRKLEALVKATTDDMKKAETAVLRMANDRYRKVIYNAQVYANTGAGTYEKAVDMATKDFLSAGLNCIEYANGARHTLADYADMAIRTACKRAYLQGEGVKRQEWGISTVIMNKRGNPCPLCLPFVGKVLIDDVWSNGTKDGKSPETGIKYPLMSKAVAAGLYHPRCRDSHTTYFEGISTPPDDKYTKEELDDLVEKNRLESRQQYAQRQEKKFERLENHSLDEQNQKRYAERREEWKQKCKTLENITGRNELPKDQHQETPTLAQTIAEGDKEFYRKEIAEIRKEKEEIEKRLQSAKDEEKKLTQKVYFEMDATPEEVERLKRLSGEIKEIQKKFSDLEETIVSKQTSYKNAIEKKLIEDGVIEEVKLSGKMTPETADEFDTVIRHLKQKYGIMPKAVIYSPLKVEDATATYNWLDDTIYVSNRFNDSSKYLKTVKKSEDSFVEYNKHYKVKEAARNSLEEAEMILKDKGIKGYERSKALLKKTSAEIALNENRMSVRENLMDVFVHEYGHFVHRHANMHYTLKKEHYGMRELGGNFRGGDWVYEINKQYSAKAKVLASKISRFAATSPYETFAEGFLALEKGEQIPEEIASIIFKAEKEAGIKMIEKSFELELRRRKRR